MMRVNVLENLVVETVHDRPFLCLVFLNQRHHIILNSWIGFVASLNLNDELRRTIHYLKNLL